MPRGDSLKTHEISLISQQRNQLWEPTTLREPSQPMSLELDHRGLSCALPPLPGWVRLALYGWWAGQRPTRTSSVVHHYSFLSTCPILLSTHHIFISPNFSPRLDPHAPLFLTMILMLQYSDSPLEPSSPPSWIEFKATPVSLSFSHCPHPLHHRLGKTDPITVFLNFTG